MTPRDHEVLDALPVRLLVAGRDASSIRRWIEGVAGWQPVADGTSPVGPALTVLDVEAARNLPDGPWREPALLLVDDDTPPLAAADAAVAVGAAAVLRWPADLGRLREAAGPLVRRRHEPAAPQQQLRVAGAAGGVGTSTVALALGGLVAWSGRRVVVLVHDRSTGDATGSGRTWETVDGVPLLDAGAPVGGVPGLSVVRCRRPVDQQHGDASGVDLVIRDLRPGNDTDVLLVRRDRAGLTALQHATAAVVVVVDQGPAAWSSVRAAADGRRVVRLSWSNRVARAVLADRVPAGLPGTWLRELGAVLGKRP